MKGTELWDDSALISAFDAAMTSYKEMHTECLHGRALDKEKDDKDNKESDAVLAEEAMGGRRVEAGNTMEETCTPSCNNTAAANDHPTQENDIGANCSVPEFNPPLISDPYVNPTFDGYSDHQNWNYNELLRQYNELELRKEKIVEQLWLANHWNYQTQDQCPTGQLQQVSVSGGPAPPGTNTSCPWCTCQCPMASALSMGYACSSQQILCCSGIQVQQEAGGAHCSTHPGKCPSTTSFSMNSLNHLPHVDDRAVETGTMPVELVRNSVKADLPSAFDLHGGMDTESMDVIYSVHTCETKNGEYDASGKDLSSSSQKTDLTSVINAWYWAGYHTGRYLSEQEQSNKLNNHSGGAEQRTDSQEKGSCS